MWVQDNYALYGGGAVYIRTATDTLADTHHTFFGDQFTGNSAGGRGGALTINFPEAQPIMTQSAMWSYRNNTNRLEHVLFVNNSAPCPQCMGGALDISGGYSTLIGCTFIGNRVR